MKIMIMILICFISVSCIIANKDINSKFKDNKPNSDTNKVKVEKIDVNSTENCSKDCKLCDNISKNCKVCSAGYNLYLGNCYGIINELNINLLIKL